MTTIFHARPARVSIRSVALVALLAALIAAAARSHATPPPATADHARIAQVLEDYRTAVSTGDEALFSTTLLDDDIPFFAVGDDALPASLDALGTRGVEAFRRSVFHGGRRYTQRFDDVRIMQDGALAQASLRFETLRSDGSGGAGWKTVTLVEVGGAWKIASEFYTVRDLTVGDAAEESSTPAIAPER